MNKSFSTIKTNVGNMVQDTSVTFSSLIGVWINNKYQDVVQRYDWEDLYYIQTITASANTSAYALDDISDRIISVLDDDTDNYLLEKTQQQFYMENYTDRNTVGTPQYYFPSFDVVRSQPASATKVMVKSSSASDTTQTVLLRGLVSGSEVYESITLNGTTQASAASSYTRVLGISKSAATTGYITASENNGTTILTILSPETLESRCRQINFNPIPSGSLTFKILTKRRVLPLSQSYDYPVIRNVGGIIELGAIADALRYKRQFAKAKEFDMQYEKMLSDRISEDTIRPNLIYQFQPTPLDRNEGIL
jgi:hypothetical protein